MAGYFNEDGQFVFGDQPQTNAACPTDPMDALQCDSCQ